MRQHLLHGLLTGDLARMAAGRLVLSERLALVLVLLEVQPVLI